MDVPKKSKRLIIWNGGRSLHALFGVLCISPFGIQPPSNLADLFGCWIHGLS